MNNTAFFNMVYNESDIATKILLKTWLYEMTYASTPMDFNTYTAFFQITNLVELINGYCIDLSDIGTKEEAIQILLKYTKRGEI